MCANDTHVYTDRDRQRHTHRQRMLQGECGCIQSMMSSLRAFHMLSACISSATIMTLSLSVISTFI